MRKTLIPTALLLAAVLPASAPAAEFPDVQLAATPKLHVSESDPGKAWITFRTTKPIANPRLALGVIKGLEGRVYKAKGTNCYRAAMAVELKAGRKYMAHVIVRDRVANEYERKAIASHALTARSARRAPAC